MKIEISVAEQDDLLFLLQKGIATDNEDTCVSVGNLEKFVDRLKEIKAKRNKKFNDKIEFDVGDIVYVEGQDKSYPIIAIQKDSKDRIFYYIWDGNYTFGYRGNKLQLTVKKMSENDILLMKKEIFACSYNNRDILKSKKYFKTI